MTKKLETSPDGIVCANCGQDKPAYHFYSIRGKSTRVTKYFFASPDRRGDQCWECNAPYKCISCGNEQAADQFRVGGRICITCKSSGKHRELAEIYARQVVSSSEDTYNDENALESEFAE